MPDNVWNTVYGAGGGLLVALLGIFGIKSRIENLEKNKVSKDAFNEYQTAQKNDHNRIESSLDKIFDKIELIHKDMPKRNGR